MKAISVQQPWAWGLLNGKPVENRTWPTSYRGPILLHAGKRFDEDGWDDFVDLCNQTGIPVPDKDSMKRGGFVGISDLVDCVTHHNSPWFFGPYGFVMANARPIEFIPYRGQLGIFEVPDEVLKGRI